jgi:hypothetical protein
MRKRNTLPTSPPSQGGGVLGPVLGAADALTQSTDKPVERATEPSTPAILPIAPNAPNAAEPAAEPAAPPNTPAAIEPRIAETPDAPAALETPERRQPELQGIDGGQSDTESLTSRPPAPRPATKPNTPKERRPFYISRDVIEEARGAVEALLGTEHRISLNLLAENALKRELKRLAKAYNDGEPFHPPARQLPVGRQMGR